MYKDNEQEEKPWMEGLSFGGRGGNRTWIYARYIMGDPLSVIASEANMSVGKAYNLMRERPKIYEKVKQARQEYLDSQLPAKAVVKRLNRRLLRLSKEGKEYCLQALEHRNDKKRK